MKIEIMERPEFQVVGIDVRTVNAAERTPETAKIPKLWKRWFDEKISGQVPNATNDAEVFAVYFNYENDYQGFYTLLIGHQSTASGPLPGVLKRTDVPEQQYLVLPPVPAKQEEIARVWQEVWNYFSQISPFKRAYGHDFEVYRDRTMQLFLGVEPR